MTHCLYYSPKFNELVELVRVLFDETTMELAFVVKDAKTMRKMKYISSVDLEYIGEV